MDIAGGQSDDKLGCCVDAMSVEICGRSPIHWPNNPSLSQTHFAELKPVADTAFNVTLAPFTLPGNHGDVEPVGEGVSELRINYGPGYRVYFKKRGRELIILLAGGDKTTQAKDIKAALRLARNLSE